MGYYTADFESESNPESESAKMYLLESERVLRFWNHFPTYYPDQIESMSPDKIIQWLWDTGEFSMFSFRVIGAFGDSDPNTLSDWIPLILDGFSMTPAELSRAEKRSTPTPDDSTHTLSLKCDSIFTAMEMRFLHAFVGSVTNPQSKIIGASIRY